MRISDWSSDVCSSDLAVLGNTVNYSIGRYIGPKVFTSDSRFLDRNALIKTHAFYDKHGGKTIVLSRFLPIFRTFAPFVAGGGSMNVLRFQLFNISDAVLWLCGLATLGYFFSTVPSIKVHLRSSVLIGVRPHPLTVV